MTRPSEEEPIPGELAARIQDDPWARALGVEYLEIRRGYCRLGLALQPHMVNFQGFPYGGVIFSVADIGLRHGVQLSWGARGGTGRASSPKRGR